METQTIILISIAVVVFYIIMVYNGLIKLRTNTKESWSDIEVQMKRRYDLIPQLINTVKGYMTHERETLEAITEARNAAMANQGSVESQAKNENMLTGALKSIFALSESYPDLKANENFVELQRELADTENKIQASRRFYNSNVREINIAVQVFPKNLIAKAFNFTKMAFFELEESEKAAASNPVEVKF